MIPRARLVIFCILFPASLLAQDFDLKRCTREYLSVNEYEVMLWKQCIDYAKSNPVDHEIQFKIGLAYHHGFVDPIIKENYRYEANSDLKNAIIWYKKAYDNGNIKAPLNLAIIYESGGIGVIKNYIEALKYLKLSMANDTGSSISISEYYEKGRGVDKNISEAYKWMLIANYFGWNRNNYIAEKIKQFETNLDTSEINKSQKAANKCIDSKFKNCD